MTDAAARKETTISQETLIAIISRFEDRREFFMLMYAQNPQLRRTAGKRVNDMLTPLHELQTQNELQVLAAFAL